MGISPRVISAVCLKRIVDRIGIDRIFGKSEGVVRSHVRARCGIRFMQVQWGGLRRAADWNIPTRSIIEGQFRRSLTYVSGYDWRIGL